SRDAEDVLLRATLAEDELVFRRVVSEPVIADAPVVVLVAGSDGARRGMHRVEETAVDPGDRAPLRVRDAVRKILPGRGLDDVQRRHLVAAARKPVRDESRVGRRVVPVHRDEAVAGEPVRVDARAVWTVDRVPNVEDGRLLLPLPTRV